MRVHEKETIDQILDKKGFTEQWLNENKDICYTKRRKEKLLFTSDAKNAFRELLQQKHKTLNPKPYQDNATTNYNNGARQVLDDLLGDLE